MDPTRQIRLLIPPFFFYTSLLSAWFFTEIQKQGGLLYKQDLSTIATVAVIVGASSIPVGFLLSTITFLFLRLFRLFGLNHETGLSEENIDKIWPFLGTELPRRKLITKCRKRTKRYIRHFVSVTIDHEIIYRYSKGIQEWMARSYSAYWVSACSATALLFSFIVVLSSEKLHAPCEWWIASVVVFVVMVLGAINARYDTFKMQEFQLHRNALIKRINE